MKTFTFFLILCTSALPGLAQNISVTFAGTGNVTQIDSVTATNLSTSQSVTLPGNAILVLSPQTDVPALLDDATNGVIFPNPFSGRTTLLASVQQPQTVQVIVRNLTGQVVTQAQSLIKPGENEFSLSLTSEGIYVVSLVTDRGTTAFKVVCTASGGPGNQVKYLGSASTTLSSPLKTGSRQPTTYNRQFKSGLTSYSLGYSANEIILYKCKSGIYTTFFSDSPLASKTYPVEFSDCTDQGGINYPSVIIGNQTWMAQNLAWLPEVSPSNAGSATDKHYYVYGYQGTGMADATATGNYATYGVLYNWEAARIACPNGWGLPTDAEWNTLTDYLGSTAGGKMKETGITHWSEPNTGATNETGFGALPGGFRTRNGSFSGLAGNTFYWSSTGETDIYAWYRSLLSDNDQAERDYHGYRENGFSVRCLKGGASTNTPPTAAFTISPGEGITDDRFTLDASSSSDKETNPEDLQVRWDLNGDGNWETDYSFEKTAMFSSPVPGLFTVFLEVKDAGGLADTETHAINVTILSFTDPRDGNVYPYKKIGTQSWMTKNLAWLPSVSPGSVGSYTENFYYVYGYEGTDVAAAKQNIRYKDYGVLYNWPAAMAACPTGWHIPGDAEWKTLERFLGMSAAAADSNMVDRVSGQVGGKIKETGSIHWQSPNNGATNSSGFTALPGGFCYRQFIALGTLSIFWSSTSSSRDTSWAYVRQLYNPNATIYRGDDAWKISGFSVRCVKD